MGRKHANKQIGKLQTQKDILRLIFCTRRNVETTKNLVNAALQVPKEINTQ